MSIVDVAQVVSDLKKWQEVADENAELRSENAELRAALREYLFAGIGNSTNFETQANARNMAREVLERTKK
jgi:regulator of replication initiation timing